MLLADASEGSSSEVLIESNETLWMRCCCAHGKILAGQLLLGRSTTAPSLFHLYCGAVEFKEVSAAFFFFFPLSDFQLIFFFLSFFFFVYRGILCL